MVRKIAKRAGVERFNLHSFRHAYAKWLVNAGTSHKVIQELLGHEDISTMLNMYVVYTSKELGEHHREYGNIDNLFSESKSAWD